MSPAATDGSGRSLPPGIERGLALSVEGRFFEAHEEMEQAWLAETSELRTLWQGLIQAVVACHHIANGNRGGARKMIAAARPKLRAFADRRLAIDVRRLERDLELVRAGLDQGERLADLPLPVPRRLELP